MKLITRRCIEIILFFLTIFFSQAVTAAPMLTIEDKIKNFTADQQQHQVLLLKQLVNINSGTNNLAGVYQVGELLRPEFERLGFKTHWANEPASMHRAGTLIAEHPGIRGKKLLLIGHLDTVFPQGSAFQKFEWHGSTATGPGVIDDKGSDLVMLYALKALHAAHVLDDAAITVVLTGDEEDSGKPTSVSRKPLIEAARHSDIALDFEWSIALDSATVARRGISSWTIEAQGQEAHSSEIFKRSDGAIFELARILSVMRQQLAQEKYLSFNPGIILGGSIVNYDKDNSRGTVFGGKNVIAKTAIARGDLRFLTPEQKTNAEKTISSIVSHHLLGTTATVIFQDAIPSMPLTTANMALLKQYSEVSVDLGYGPVKALDPGLRGAGDISHVASMMQANLAGLGAAGTGAHSVKETLLLNSLPIQTQRAALLIYRLTHA